MCNLCLHDRRVVERRPKKAKALPTKGTHEQYISAIYRTVLKHAPGNLHPDTGKPQGLDKVEATKLRAIKLTYGAGPSGARGVTYYSRWKRPTDKEAIPFLAINAINQESHVQVCGTVLHELGHVLAGWGAGHSQSWVNACTRIGLVKVNAEGTQYSWEKSFSPAMAKLLQAIPLPADGAPVSPLGAKPGDPLGPWGRPVAGGGYTVRPCGAGFGTRGGKSRGQGSGSRYLKYTCKCVTRKVEENGKERPVYASVRHAGEGLDATCNKCKSKFELDRGSLPPAHKPAPVEATPAKKVKKAKKKK